MAKEVISKLHIPLFNAVNSLNKEKFNKNFQHSNGKYYKSLSSNSISLAWIIERGGCTYDCEIIGGRIRCEPIMCVA
jgi:hypothetical protein